MAKIIEGISTNTDLDQFKDSPSDRVVAKTNIDGTLTVIIYTTPQKERKTHSHEND